MARDYLLVIDMQNDFVDGSLGTPEAAAIVNDVAEHARTFEGTVVFTYDTHRDDYLETQEGKHLPVPHCIKGTPGWKLAPVCDLVRRARNARVFEKRTFGSTALASWLLDKNAHGGGVASVELCGLCTDICVVSNALLIKAFMPEVPVRVNPNLCAGVTPETHEAALTTMRMCQIDLIEE